MKKIIYLVRHAEAMGQEETAPLSKVGQEQARELVSFFKNKSIKQILSSPYLRARQTIKPLAKALNQEIIIEEKLSERVLSSENLPDWKEKLEATFLDEDLSFFGGETSREALGRIRTVITQVESETILVTHGNIMALLLGFYDPSFGFKEWEKLTNPDIYKLILEANDFSLERMYNKKK